MKQTKDYTVKDVVSFYLSDDFPEISVFKGAKDQFSITIQADINIDGKDITTSDALFGVEYVMDRYLKAGDEVYAMDQSFGGIHHKFIGNITQVSNVNFINPYGIVMDIEKNGCGLVYFDVIDFQGKFYTMKADL